MIHVAVVHGRYLDAILAGAKRVESRLARVRCEPFGVIAAGERVYFKERGGAVRATAVVAWTEFHEQLTPARIAALQRRHNARVVAPEEYWRAKEGSRFATFVGLGSVEAVRFGPRFPVFCGRAWQRLPDSADVYPRCLDREALGRRAAG
jgi:ASC-1-like (ASCH) protein